MSAGTYSFFQKVKLPAGEIDRFDRFQRCEYWFGMLVRRKVHGEEMEKVIFCCD